MFKCSNVEAAAGAGPTLASLMFQCSNVEAAARVGPTPASVAPSSTSTSTLTSVGVLAHSSQSCPLAATTKMLDLDLFVNLN